MSAIVQKLSSWVWYSKCMCGWVRAEKELSGCFRVMAATGAMSIVHFPQRGIICLVAECLETKFVYQNWYKGKADFKVPAKVGKWIRSKPTGEMCCFFVTIYG